MLLFFAFVHDLKGVKKNRRVHLNIVFWTFFLLAGLRHGIGGDTYQYRVFWNLLPEFKKVTWGDLTMYRYEFGWVLLCFMVKSVFGSFVFLQLIISWLLNKGIMKIVKKYTEYPFLVLLLFFISGEQYFYMEFEFCRQAVSVAIFLLWGIDYLENRKNIHYCITIVICTMFHFASIFFLFLPFIWNWRYSRRKTIYLIFFMLLIAIPLLKVLSSLEIIHNLQALNRVADNIDTISSGDNDFFVVSRVIYCYIVYYSIIAFGITYYNIKIKFPGALFVGFLICAIAPFFFDTIRLMYFIVIFIDIVLAQILVRFSRRDCRLWAFGVLSYMVVSNVIFIWRYTQPRYMFYMYPYYSWFEEEPDSHKRELRGREIDNATILLQIYDSRKH